MPKSESEFAMNPIELLSAIGYDVKKGKREAAKCFNGTDYLLLKDKTGVLQQEAFVSVKVDKTTGRVSAVQYSILYTEVSQEEITALNNIYSELDSGFENVGTKFQGFSEKYFHTNRDTEFQFKTSYRLADYAAAPYKNVEINGKRYTYEDEIRLIFRVNSLENQLLATLEFIPFLHS